MTLRNRITVVKNDDTWRYPIITGGVTIPLIVVLQHLGNELYVLAPTFLVGFLLGVWAVDKSISGARIGWRTGIVSGFSLVYGVVTFLYSTSHIWFEGASILLTISTLVIVPVVAVLFILIYGVVGAIGGIVGDWVYNIHNQDTKPAID